MQSRRVPPPSPAEVEAFEAEMGTTLPDDYRQFLLRSNVGRLGRDGRERGPAGRFFHRLRRRRRPGGLRRVAEASRCRADEEKGTKKKGQRGRRKRGSVNYSCPGRRPNNDGGSATCFRGR